MSYLTIIFFVWVIGFLFFLVSLTTDKEIIEQISLYDIFFVCFFWPAATIHYMIYRRIWLK